MTAKHYTTTLSIAGSDPGGGAGIQADLKTFSALGCYGMSVITALTAQNTQGVQAIETLPVAFVMQQLQSLFNDIDIQAIKIGMLSNHEIIETLARYLTHQPQPLIVDPVMTAKDGSQLLATNAITALKDYILPLTTLLTPNIPEAELLLGTSITTRLQMEQAAKSLADIGPAAVLIKGGHLTDTFSNDCLYTKVTRQLLWFDSPRINTVNTHGTGCTLSAAITAFIAKGKPLSEAVQQAKHYLYQAIQHGSHYHLGKGHGPVHHFYAWWNE